MHTWYLIVGMRRSGIHAIGNWLMNQVSEPCAFFNDVDPLNPFERARLQNPEVLKSDENISAITCYEDRVLQTVGEPAQLSDRLWPPNRMIVVLVLRNPFNLMASRMKHHEMSGTSEVSTTASTYISGLSVTELWVSYGQEFIGKSKVLGDNTVMVNYDRWSSDREYRRDVADELGVTFTDLGKEDVTHYGRGSSFSGTGFDGSASHMEVESRWRSYRNSPEYRDLFKDRIVFELASQCFSFTEDLQDFVTHELLPTVSWRREMKRRVALVVMPTLVTLARRNSVIRWLYDKGGQRLLRRIN